MSARVDAKAELRHELASLLSADERLIRDPYPLYRRLRDEAPVLVHDPKTVVVSSHPEAKLVSRDHTRFLSIERPTDPGAPKLRLLTEEDLGRYRELVALEKAQMNTMNGELHRRVRSAGARAFTPRRLEALRESIQRLTDELLDALAAEDEPDFMHFAYRLPLLVIMEMLGVPREDAELLRDWGDAIVAHAGEFPMQPATLARSYEGMLEYRRYVRDLIDQHRRGGERVELVGLLLDASESDSLTEDELVSMYVLLLFAGHETTANMFGNGLLALLRNRDQWELLCSDPSLASDAIEEALRYDTPVQFFSKHAPETVELAGVEIPSGATVMIAHAAANRDPRVFDRPDELDITRTPNDHFSFGHGIHFCLGAGVARLEGRIGLETLARRFPEIELAETPETLEYNSHHVLRGLRRLRIRLGPERAG